MSAVERLGEQSSPFELPFGPEDGDSIYAVGRHLYDQSEYVRAAEIFRLLALLAPERSRSWTALAACHEALGDADRACALYGLALTVAQHDEHRSIAALYKARLDLDAGDRDAAFDSLEAADPQDAEQRRLHQHLQERLRAPRGR